MKMVKTVGVFLLFWGLQLSAQDMAQNMKSCPMHKEHMQGASQQADEDMKSCPMHKEHMQGEAHHSDQDMMSCPMHKEHTNGMSQHQADVEKHGDEGMGFPHDKTTHHFRLYPDGGAIEVVVNDNKDSENIQAIRMHLTHITAMFSNGDFSIPMFVHDQVPPGADVMKEKRADIRYNFEQVPEGGRVRIRATNPEALKAIHDFLRFQIEDHHTGDPTAVSAGN
jgi:hypothetical protein